MNNSVHIFIRITAESLIKETVNYDTVQKCTGQMILYDQFSKNTHF